MSAPAAEFLRRLVGRMQRVFYPETVGAPAEKQRGFYRDLALLRQAATWPSTFIRDNGTGEFDEGRYEEIFTEILKKVALHGPSIGEMRCRGAYILKAVQDHWRHNWEEYQPESKSAAARVQRELRALLQAGAAQVSAEARTMEVLAATYDAMKTGRPKGKAAGKGKAEAKGLGAPGKAATGEAKGREIQSELF